MLLQKLEREITLKLIDRVTVLAIALPLMAIYQCIKFQLIPFYTFRDMPRTSFLLQKIKGSNSVNTGDRVMVLAFCNSPHGPLSVYQVSLNYLQYIDMLLQKCDGQTLQQFRFRGVSTVNFHKVLRAISSLTQRFIMYLNGIKHNVVTKLNPRTLNVGPDGWTDRQTNGNYMLSLWGA